MGDPWKLVEDSLSGIFQNKKHKEVEMKRA